VNKEAELLIKLNDLELLIKETEDREFVEKGLGFKMEKREELLSVRQRIRAAIRPETLGRFDRAWKRYGRALAPVDNGVCCGCFGRLPTAMSSASYGPADDAPSCPFCARILYWTPAE
jgi:predicted  nucleic acid-binding Zn-ribbon protein